MSIPAQERQVIFTHACFYEWQSLGDLMYLLDCKCEKTVQRIVKRMRLMYETFELYKYVVEVCKVPAPTGGHTVKIRIMLNPNLIKDTMRHEI